MAGKSNKRAGSASKSALSEGPALFASRPEESRGRLYSEPESLTRTVFQRDRDRIIHSSAFRRLKHKTQVFVYHEGDYYRTRLTHSIEVAQIARSLSRVVGLNEDLAEALALAHDFGHPPFGHAGEDALAEAMAPYGGFDHNAQSLRVVTSLEQRYAEFDGLNLTWETLEGIVKHNGPLIRKGRKLADLPEAVRVYNKEHDLELDTYASAEAQIAALSDDIAYNNHDIDDGLRAGLFTLDDLKDVPLVGPVLHEVTSAYPDLDEHRTAHELVRRMIDRMINDVLEDSRRRIVETKPKSAEAVRHLGCPLIGFSAEMQENDKALKAFLYEHMYRHYRVNRMASKARRVVDDLFALYMAEPECLPTPWRLAAEAEGKGKKADTARARLVADFIAGMTDRYALSEHKRLFDLTAIDV
jgi:dGTPase